MSDPGPLYFSRLEIESYLPTGWSLLEDDPEGSWDEKAEVWRGCVIDGVDYTWPVEVEAAAAASQGRLPALRSALDLVFRGRLGAHTRGLGIG